MSSHAKMVKWRQKNVTRLVYMHLSNIIYMDYDWIETHCTLMASRALLSVGLLLLSTRTISTSALGRLPRIVQGAVLLLLLPLLLLLLLASHHTTQELCDITTSASLPTRSTHQARWLSLPPSQPSHPSSRMGCMAFYSQPFLPGARPH
jgi:hypothetical protein